jgi:hypothetical protein
MTPIEQLESINMQVRENFSSLSDGQLNWKSEPAKWSIGQCLDHLIISNKTYFPSFEKLIYHRYKLSFLQKLNPFKKMLGPMMIRSLGPQQKKNFKSPTIFEPSASQISFTIVDDFLRHQEELKTYFRKLLQLDTKNLVLASPVSGLITYTLADCMQLIPAHEQRHTDQANKVLHHPNFPR